MNSQSTVWAMPRKPFMARNLRKAAYPARRAVKFVRRPSGIYRSLTSGPKSHSFIASFQDYNVAFLSGQSGGMNIYGSGSVPGQGIPLAPTTAGSAAGVFMWTLNFSLQQINSTLYDTGGVARGTSTLGLSNFAEYANLFDEYVLDKIVMELYFNGNSSSLGTTAGHVSLPCLGCAIDYDDSNFTQIQSMQQYSNYRIIQLGQQGPRGTGKQTITFKPKFAAVVQTLAGTAVGMPYRGWLDTVSPTAEHFGLKFFFLNTEVGTGGAPVYIGDLQVSTKLHFRCRGTK